MTPQIGDLVFVHSDTLVGDLIDWAEKGQFSHVAIYMGNGQVIEAQGFEKVQYKPLSAYEGRYVIGHVQASLTQRRWAVQWWRKQIGKRYAWGIIGHLALKLVLHINLPIPITAKEFICSTLGRMGWVKGGVVLTKNADATPQDLANSPLVHLYKP